MIPYLPFAMSDLPPSELTVAAVQMSSQDDRDENLRRATSAVRAAAKQGANVVFLPENFAYMGAEARKLAIAEDLGPVNESGGSDHRGPILRALAAAAAESGVFVVGGGMPERSPDPARTYNACVVVGPDGALVARYRKMHLFDVDVGDGQSYRESAATAPGDDPVVAEALGWKIGLSVCYDVRFPELYRALTARGADLMAVPAAFTVATGKDHWSVLLRARAIEAQAFVVAPAQWGKHPRGRQTYGKSLIIDPWGEVIAQCSEGEGIAIARLRRDYLDQVRKSLPALTHRRTDRLPA
jgi:predicted amidohydrolase